MKKVLTLGIVVVAVLALALAWRSYETARAMRAEIAKLATERARLAEAMKAADERLRSAKRDQSEIDTALASIRASAPAPAPVKKTAGAPKPRNPDAAETLALLEANPALYEMFKQSVRSGLNWRYRSFYAAANLSPEQIAKFEEAMLQDAEDRMTLAALAQKPDVAKNDPAIPKMKAELETRVSEAQKQALGEAGYQTLQEYQRVEPANSFIAQVANLVTDLSEPLTEAQATQLRDVLARSSSSYQAGGKVDPGQIDWRSAEDQARSLLTPAQLAAWRANAVLPQVFAYVKDFYDQEKAATGK